MSGRSAWKSARLVARLETWPRPTLASVMMADGTRPAFAICASAGRVLRTPLYAHPVETDAEGREPPEQKR